MLYQTVCQLCMVEKKKFPRGGEAFCLFTRLPLATRHQPLLVANYLAGPDTTWKTTSGGEVDHRQRADLALNQQQGHDQPHSKT